MAAGEDVHELLSLLAADGLIRHSLAAFSFHDDRNADLLVCGRNLSNPDIFPLTRSAVSTSGRNSLLSARAFRPTARSRSATGVHNRSDKSCTCPGRAAPAIRVIRLQRERRVIEPRFREAAKRHGPGPRPTVYRPARGPRLRPSSRAERIWHYNRDVATGIHAPGGISPAGRTHRSLP